MWSYDLALTWPPASKKPKAENLTSASVPLPIPLANCRALRAFIGSLKKLLSPATMLLPSTMGLPRMSTWPRIL